MTDCRICLFRLYDRIPGASKLRNRGFVLTGGPGTQASGSGRQSRKTLVTLHQYRKHIHSRNTGRRETQMNAVFSSLSLLFSVQTTVQGAAHIYSGPSLSVNLLYLVYAWRFVSMVIQSPSRSQSGFTNTQTYTRTHQRVLPPLLAVPNTIWGASFLGRGGGDRGNT